MKKLKVFIVPLLFGLFLSSCKDSSTEPDAQFVQIFFKYEFKNELNTFENTYQKDLFMDGVTKVKFWLTNEEQNCILRKAEEVNYFTLADTINPIPLDSILIWISPDPGAQTLRIKYNTLDKTTVWYHPLNESNPQTAQIMELRSYIVSLIESKPEYKKLPPVRGGYD